jgi:D-alanyl-D-alanine dipeptidase
LQRYNWKENGWQAVGEKLSINVGKNGLAWGKGLYTFEDKEALHKQEGDGRSPAGIFHLLTAFGYAHPDSLSGLKFPYEHVDAFTQCIEDTASAFYNRIVDGQQTESDWNSTDFMLRKDDLYEWGVFVGHNAGGDTQAGDGSCIFMHAWRKAGSGTAGCTAMEKQHMKEIVFWLDQDKNPLLVQVPADAYPELRKQFKLPK